MNRYLVSNEDVKHLSRVLVLRKIEWNEEIDDKGNLWFNTEVDAVHFNKLVEVAREYKEEEKDYLSIRFQASLNKPGIIHCIRRTMEGSSFFRVDLAIVERYIELMEEERNRKFSDEEKESYWIREARKVDK